MSDWHPEWPGFNARGSLLLPLPASAFAGLDARCELDGLVFGRKREFHVTLLDRALGARLQGRPHAAERLPALFAALDWQWRRGGERWLLREARDGAVAHSIIELIAMPALAEFRREAGQLSGEVVAQTPTHVTLYARGSENGIGLASAEEFERLRLRRL